MVTEPREAVIRPFTEQERQGIERKLRDTGRALFASHGWKKTGVDDLCRAAGIARGSFYLFYASKDAFFLSLLAEAEVAVKEDLVAVLSNPDLDGAMTLRLLLEQTLTVIERHPLLRFAFADPDEPAPWLRSLEGAPLEVLTDGDDETAGQILGLLEAKGLRLAVEPGVLAGVLRALVLLPLSRKTIGEAVFDKVKGALVASLARGLS